MVDPEIDIEYYIPEMAVTSKTCDLSKDPYILVAFSIRRFRIEIESVEMG